MLITEVKILKGDIIGRTIKKIEIFRDKKRVPSLYFSFFFVCKDCIVM